MTDLSTEMERLLEEAGGISAVALRFQNVSRQRYHGTRGVLYVASKPNHPSYPLLVSLLENMIRTKVLRENPHLKYCYWPVLALVDFWLRDENRMKVNLDYNWIYSHGEVHILVREVYKNSVREGFERFGVPITSLQTV